MEARMSAQSSRRPSDTLIPSRPPDLTVLASEHPPAASNGKRAARAPEVLAASGRQPTAERQLREMRQRYHALAEATGQIIWTADASGRLTGDCAPWCSFTGQSATQAQGWGWLSAVHPDDRAGVAYAWALATDRAAYEHTTRLRRYDDVYRRVAMRAVPMLDGDGQIQEWVGTCTDVTEQRQLEQRTHEALEALLALAEVLVDTRQPVESAPAQTRDAMAALRAPMRGLARVTRDVLGCRRVALVAIEPETEARHGLAIVGLTPEQERRWWEEQAAAPRLGDTPFPEFAARLRSGETLLLDMTRPPFVVLPNLYGAQLLLVAPMRVGDQLLGMLTLDYGGESHAYTRDEQALAGAVAKLGALVIDRERLVHERAEARSSELALREANRRMDEFIGVAGHELRTPITSALINVQLAERHLLRTQRTSAIPDELVGALDRVQGLLARTEYQMKRQNRLVSDLIEVSRIQAGKLALRMAPFDLVALLRESVGEHRPDHPERAIALTLSRQSVPMTGDPDRMRQVVTNYLSNALKYSPESTRVAVRLRVNKRSVRVSVRDEGPGLPASEHERVWERFHRVDGVVAQSGSGVGLGLGLHISRTIIERHGGQVGVSSTPGHGATFWFTLPLTGAEVVSSAE
jgi:PAS domain S-box-containing protein